MTENFGKPANDRPHPIGEALMTVSETKLLPCPFCGLGNSMVAPWFDDVSKRWAVGCGRCGSSSGRSVHADGSKEAAIKSWNTRGLTAALSDQAAEQDLAFVQICDELKCAYDSESALIALDNLKQRASGGETDLLLAAAQMRDLLTADGDPPSVIVPEGTDDPNDFTQAFDDLATAIRVRK